MPINNKLLALFEGKCWHDTDDCTAACKHCGEWIWKTPNYATDPADRERLLQYLMGQGEMWKTFKTDILTAKIGEPYDTDLIVYLFLPVDNIPRWLFLLQEWLILPETLKDFGRVECPVCKGHRTFANDHILICRACNDTGKVLTEWAKVQDEKEG